MVDDLRTLRTLYFTRKCQDNETSTTEEMNFTGRTTDYSRIPRKFRVKFTEEEILRKGHRYYMEIVRRGNCILLR